MPVPLRKIYMFFYWAATSVQEYLVTPLVSNKSYVFLKSETIDYIAFNSRYIKLLFAIGKWNYDNDGVLRLRIVDLLCNQILPACLLGSYMKEEMCNNAFSMETLRWHGVFFIKMWIRITITRRSISWSRLSSG